MKETETQPSDAQAREASTKSNEQKTSRFHIGPHPLRVFVRTGITAGRGPGSGPPGGGPPDP